jgi:ubiquitin C-terminal hydrolase
LYQGEYNEVEIIPDEYIDMRNYVDTFFIETKYELIAINIRIGKQKNFGHEICQVKRQGKWFELNDEKVDKKIKSYNNYSYGLFYKRL